jgi:dTDP-4-dehydrorhamnose 3,5-epimerase
VNIRELEVPHAWEIAPVLRGDDRGLFLESYRSDLLAEATGRHFTVVQGNVSVSRRGVGRGIHFAELPGGQAKYFTVVAGSVVDFVVDIRVGSPTFGTWAAVELDDQNRKATFVSEGLGHFFVVTSESATVSYQVNAFYNPARESTVSVLDPVLDLAIPVPAADLVLSPQDVAAPTLAEAQAGGVLPTWEAALATYAAASDPGGPVAPEGAGASEGQRR